MYGMVPLSLVDSYLVHGVSLWEDIVEIEVQILGERRAAAQPFLINIEFILFINERMVLSSSSYFPKKRNKRVKVASNYTECNAYCYCTHTRLSCDRMHSRTLHNSSLAATLCTIARCPLRIVTTDTLINQFVFFSETVFIFTWQNQKPNQKSYMMNNRFRLSFGIVWMPCKAKWMQTGSIYETWILTIVPLFSMVIAINST